MSQSFLVVGGSGQVGSGVARILREQGHEVRTTTGKAPVSPEQVRVDLLSGEGLDAAFEGVRRAFLLSPAGYPDQYRILAPLVRKAKEAGLEKVVLMTAIGVEANDAAPMRRAEIDLEKSGLAWNILRPSWFMQNFQTYWLHDIRTHGALRLPAGDGKTGFIDARDIAAAAVRLLTTHDLDNRDFDLTGPRALDHDEVARVLSKASGREIAYQEIAPETLRQGLVAGGVPADYADFLVAILGLLKQGYAERTTEEVKRLTGREPIAFEQYARDNAQAWKVARAA